MLTALLDLVLPAPCAGCGRSRGPWCGDCRAALAADLYPRGARLVDLTHAPPRMPRCWAGGDFQAGLRRMLTALKDEGRGDLHGEVAALLAAVAQRAWQDDPVLRAVDPRQVLLVPLPTSRSSRRRRGCDPVGALAAALPAHLPPGVGWAPVLRLVRTPADQSRLHRGERAANLAGAMRADGAAAEVLRGRVCVVADDVVTTGATLAEAARALTVAGAGEVVAVTVAATALRARLAALRGTD